MARRNAASDHRPTPVSASGVIFDEKIVPNGVGTGRPPAKALPPRTVWQSLQLPIAARSRPRRTRAVSNDCGAGGPIAAIAGRQAKAKAAIAPATRIPATTPTTICGDFFMRLGPSSRSFVAGPCLTHIFGNLSSAERGSLAVEPPASGERRGHGRGATPPNSGPAIRREPRLRSDLPENTALTISTRIKKQNDRTFLANS